MINVESQLIGFYSGVAHGVDAYGSVPEDRPEAFITVERTGGSADRFIDHAQIAVQVWARSRAKASALAYDARRSAEQLRNTPWCANVVCGSLYNFPDPDSHHARYQFTLDIDVMVN